MLSSFGKVRTKVEVEWSLEHLIKHLVCLTKVGKTMREVKICFQQQTKII
jgi:hypothetical protein